MLKNALVGIVFLVLVLAGSISYAQLQMGVKDSVYSSILKEQRQLLVYLPKEVRQNKATSMRYPVLYVLDGDSHFSAISGMIDQLSDQGGNMVIPNMIVVFIPNTNRTRDLTPYQVKKNDFMPEEMAKESGGGEAFAKCILEEIFPFIDAKYPTSTYKGFVGHSFGGIFGLNVLANHPDMFEDYIIIDPSTWYDGRKFAQDVIGKINKGNYEGKSIFLAIANTNNVADTAKVQKLTTSFSEHEKSILDFSYKLKATDSKLKVDIKYYPEDDHNSVPMIATYDGLRSIFKDFRFTFNSLYDADFQPSISIPKYFERLSRKTGHMMHPTSGFLELCDLYYEINKDLDKQSQVRSIYAQLYPPEAKKFIDSKSKK